MSADELARLDGVAQAECVRRGELSALELVDAAIERLERLDPELGAVVHPTFDRARREARAIADAGATGFALPGVPFLLKDAGGEQAGEYAHTGIGALRRIGYKAATDSALAANVRRGGLVSLGRTNLPEFALLPTTEPEVGPITRNPWNRIHSSGGSSGGAGAAVAAGIVPIAHATDGGGSIRGPASKCGLVGLKPTRGRVSLGPLRGEHWSGFSVAGVLTRTVRDTAAALDVLAVPCPGDPYRALSAEAPFAELAARPPGTLRIAYVQDAPRDIGVHADTRAAVDAFAKTLEGLGHPVEIVRPALFEDIEVTFTYVRIVSANIARGLDRVASHLGRDVEENDFEPLSWALGTRGREISVMQHLADVEYVHRFGYALAAWQEEAGFDLLLTPTQALPPAPIGHVTSTREEPLRAFARAGPYGTFTLPFNLSGQPAISLPAGFTTGDDPVFPAGLPIGAQLVAPMGREDRLLQVANQLEAALRWPDRRPPLSAIQEVPA